MIFKKLQILRESFPSSWIRKSIFLIYPTDMVIMKGRIAGFLATKGDEIILLCISKLFRRKGIASKLLQRTRAKYAYTYIKNIKAINLYLKNGFIIDSYQNSIFGKKVRLIKKNG